MVDFYRLFWGYWTGSLYYDYLMNTVKVVLLDSLRGRRVRCAGNSYRSIYAQQWTRDSRDFIWSMIYLKLKKKFGRIYAYPRAYCWKIPL